MKGFVYGGLTWYLDPLKVYGHIPMDRLIESLGWIPTFIDARNPDTAQEQFNRSYSHGGGWQPLGGWTMQDDGTLEYPEDPPLKPIAVVAVGEQTVRVYPHAWVSVRNPDGTYEVCRMD